MKSLNKKDSTIISTKRRGKETQKEARGGKDHEILGRGRVFKRPLAAGRGRLHGNSGVRPRNKEEGKIQ